MNTYSETSKSPSSTKPFAIHSSKNAHPAGRETTKRANTVKYVINQVTKKTNECITQATPCFNFRVTKKTLLKSNEQIKTLQSSKL